MFAMYREEPMSLPLPATSPPSFGLAGFPAVQIPEKSGLPSGMRGTAAAMSTVPSALRGTPAVA